MARRKKEKEAQIGDTERAESVQKGKRAALKLLCLVAVTMVIFSVYKFFLGMYRFEIVLGVYMALASVATLGYVIYNRGFSRRGVTEEMLPSEWSEEQKTEFIEDGKRRMKRSQWLLMVVFAFFFTFAFDALELFVLPMFKNMAG